MPGKPAPEPISSQRVAPSASGRSWALSAMWRVQTVGKVDSDIRFVVRRQRASRSTKIAKRSSVSRETGTSRSAVAAIRSPVDLPRPPPNQPEPGLAARQSHSAARGAAFRFRRRACAAITRQRRRRDALDSTGLAQATRPHSGELLPHLARKARATRHSPGRPAEAARRRAGGERRPPPAARHRRRISRRPPAARRASDGISSDFRPHPRQRRERELRLRGEFERGAACAVLIDGKARTARAPPETRSRP